VTHQQHVRHGLVRDQIVRERAIVVDRRSGGLAADAEVPRPSGDVARGTSRSVALAVRARRLDHDRGARLREAELRRGHQALDVLWLADLWSSIWRYDDEGPVHINL
jgi:hypothetical protein